MTTGWLFAFISVIYRQIMDLLGVNNRKPEEHSEEESLTTPVQCTDVTYIDGCRLSVSVSVQCNEQDLTYGDEFRLFYKKLPVKDSQSLNYHNKCSQIKPTSTYRPFYGNFSLERGSGWVGDQRPRIWTEAAVQWLTKWFYRTKIPSVNRHFMIRGWIADKKDRGCLSKTLKKIAPSCFVGAAWICFQP